MQNHLFMYFEGGEGGGWWPAIPKGIVSLPGPGQGAGPHKNSNFPLDLFKDERIPVCRPFRLPAQTKVHPK